MGWFGWFGNKVIELWDSSVRRFRSIATLVSLLLGALRWFRRLKVAQGLRIAFLCTGSVSLFFVGLFLSVGGLDYLLLIDKRSMLASLFMYTAVLSSITMIVTFIPQLVPSNGFFVAAAQALGMVGFSIYIIGMEYTVLLAPLVGCLLVWAWVKWVQLKQMQEEQAREQLDHLLKVGASVLLFCSLAFGYLRGEHLRERPPSMVVHLADAPRTAVPVTVIMSSDQGVLVFEPNDPVPRFYPWHRISRMASAPEHREISQRLRNWLHAARGWIGGIPATVRGWMG